MSEEKKSMAKDSTARAGLRRWLPEVTAKKKGRDSNAPRAKGIKEAGHLPIHTGYLWMNQ